MPLPPRLERLVALVEAAKGDGLNESELADAMNLTISSLRVYISQLKARGVELPCSETWFGQRLIERRYAIPGDTD